MSEEEEQFYRTSNIWPDYEIYINGSLMKFDEDYPDASDEQRRQYEIQLNNNALLDIKNNYGDYYLKFLQQNKLVEEESQRQILELQSQRNKDIPVSNVENEKKKDEIYIKIGEQSEILREQIKYLSDFYNLGSLLPTDNVDNFINSLNIERINFLNNAVNSYIGSLKIMNDDMQKKKARLIDILDKMYDDMDNVTKKSSESKELVDILKFFIYVSQINQSNLLPLELNEIKYNIWTLIKIFFDENNQFIEPKLFFETYEKNTIISYINLSYETMINFNNHTIISYETMHKTLKQIIDLEQEINKLNTKGTGFAKKYFYQPQVKYARLNR